MTEIMLSIRPKWCELIARGQKTIEIRKTKPNCDEPFKVYIYCTKPSKKYQTAWEYIIINSGELFRSPTGEIRCADRMEMRRRDNYTADNFLNGKVIGEFVCDRVILAYVDNFDYPYYDISYDDLRETCLSQSMLFDYAKGKPIYGWHISDLVIYAKPKELSKFYISCGDNPKCDGCEAFYYSNTECGKEEFCCSIIEGHKPMKRPPQSWCYVEKESESNDE